jgi:hypothetical protein
MNRLLGEKTLNEHFDRIADFSTNPEVIDRHLRSVASLFDGVLPYSLSDIKKKYFERIENKESN